MPQAYCHGSKLTVFAHGIAARLSQIVFLQENFEKLTD